jgi:hypothetical protein
MQIQNTLVPVHNINDLKNYGLIPTCHAQNVKAENLFTWTTDKSILVNMTTNHGITRKHFLHMVLNCKAQFDVEGVRNYYTDFTKDEGILLHHTFLCPLV